MRVPIATVTIDDPRAAGRITYPGWAGQFKFAELGLGSPIGADPREYEGTQWEFGNSWDAGGCEYIRSLKSIGPQGQVARVDMNLDDWDVEFGTWTDETMPSLVPRTKFLWMYDANPNVQACLVSKENWAPRWCAVINRFVPPEGTTEPCWFGVEMIGDGTNPAWGIVVPVWNAVGLNYPALTRDDMPYGYGSYYPGSPDIKAVSYCEAPLALEGAYCQYIIWCELTLNQWIIRMVINGKPVEQDWVYSPPDYSIMTPNTPPCGSGKLRLYTQGQMISAAISPITYPVYAYARPRDYVSIPAALGSVGNSDETHIAVEPTGTAMDVTIETDGNALRPRVDFTSGGSNRAVCGVVSLYIPATIGDTVTSPWVSTGENALIDEVYYLRRCTWRGNEVRVTLRDPAGEFSWKGNNVFALDLGWQTDGYTAVAQRWFTGYITDIRERLINYDEPVLDIEAQDFWGARMPHRTMMFTGPYGGLYFEDAFKDVGNRIGFASNRIRCDDSIAPYRLGTTEILGAPTLQWTEDDDPGEALDALCRERKWRCGIDAIGDLFSEPRYVYGGIPDFTLDQDTATENDIVFALEDNPELYQFANNVWGVVGPDEQRAWGWARDTLSESDPTAPNFIGDAWTHVEKREKLLGVTRAQELADIVLAKKSTFQQVVTWETQGRVLEPGNFVEVNVNRPRIAAGSVYMIVEERGRIRLDDLEWLQSFTMVKIPPEDE